MKIFLVYGSAVLAVALGITLACIVSGTEPRVNSFKFHFVSGIALVIGFLAGSFGVWIITHWR